MLVHCDQDCMFQKDGYCTVEAPSAYSRYDPDGCVRCIRVLPLGTYEAESAAKAAPTPPAARQKPGADPLPR